MMATVKTYIRDTALEYHRGWIIRQVRTKGIYTRCKGYIAIKPGTVFFVASKHYRDIRKMIDTASASEGRKWA